MGMLLKKCEEVIEKIPKYMDLKSKGQNEEWAKYIELRHRYHGTVVLIGYLFKNCFLTENIIHHCITILKERGNAICLSEICNLLCIVGPKIGQKNSGLFS